MKQSEKEESKQGGTENKITSPLKEAKVLELHPWRFNNFPSTEQGTKTQP